MGYAVLARNYLPQNALRALSFLRIFSIRGNLFGGCHFRPPRRGHGARLGGHSLTLDIFVLFYSDTAGSEELQQIREGQ